MIHLEDLPNPRMITKPEISHPDPLAAEDTVERGNFLLQDFLKNRLDDSFEEGYDSELLLKINHLLEQDVLGGDEDEFEDGQTAKSTKNTDDNVAEQIALIRAHKVQTKNINTEIGESSLNQPLLEPEVALEPLEFNPNLEIDGYVNIKDTDQQTVFFDVRSFKAESEMYTVQDGGLQTPVPETIKPKEPQNDDTESQMEELEFRSAIEFQSVCNFSKQGDAP